jgi:hypothetical protein
MTLYRVFEVDSVSQFDEKDGFVAAALTPFEPERDPTSAKAVVERHLISGNRIPTPLISTTGSHNHALNLAHRHDTYHHKNIRVAVIHFPLFPDDERIYHMRDLVHITGASKLYRRKLRSIRSLFGFMSFRGRRSQRFTHYRISSCTVQEKVSICCPRSWFHSDDTQIDITR